jgi:hypothetical protein
VNAPTADRQALLQLAREHSPREIAAMLGVSASSIRKRLNRLGLRYDLKVRSTRPCLCCGAPFAPEHVHNRLCGQCAEGDADFEVLR